VSGHSVGHSVGMEKEQFRGCDVGVKLSELSFNIPNAIDVRKQSHIQCINKMLYDSNAGKSRKPAVFGVLDTRLGIHCISCRVFYWSNGLLFRHESEGLEVRDVRTRVGGVCRTLRFHRLSASSLPRRVLPVHCLYPAVHLQEVLAMSTSHRVSQSIRLEVSKTGLKFSGEEGHP
jgi:hypothetical protein